MAFDSTTPWDPTQWDPQQWDPSQFGTSVDVAGTYTPDFASDPSLSQPADTASGVNGAIQGTGIQGGGGSSISQIMAQLLGNKGVGGQPGSNAADLSSVLGSLSSGIKANRVTQGDFTQKYDQLMQAAQTGRNQNESDALRKLAQTSYLAGGGSQFTPPSLTLNNKTYAPVNLGFGPTPASDAQKAGAATLQSQLQARLMPGGSYTPQPLSGYATPGTGENLASGAAAGLGGLGSVLSALGAGGGSNPSTQGGGAQGGSSGVNTALGAVGTGLSLAKLAGMGTTGGLLGTGVGAGAGGAAGAGAGGAAGATGSVMGSILGKAVPLAGAATGAYGVYKNNSVGSDALSGAGSGASIGTMVMPGIGTAVGAGIGALVGAIRGLTSVTGKEMGGRDAQTAVVKQMTSQASPTQQAEASKAGWPDPNQALTLIVMRDALQKTGVPGPQAEQQAEAAMKNMWGAEKSGASNVNAAANPMLALLQNSGGTTGAPGVPGSLTTDAFSAGARG